jgi:hypothetical protein
MLDQARLFPCGQLAVDLEGALDLLLRIGHPHVRGGPVARSSGTMVSRCRPIIPVFTEANTGTSLAMSNIDRRQLADLIAVRIHHIMVAPVADVVCLEHERSTFPHPCQANHVSG